MKRKLTTAEMKRKEQFDIICEKMKQEGYQQHDLIVSIAQANTMALILMFPFVAFFSILYFFIHPSVIISTSFKSTLLFFPLLILLIFLHEMIHGLIWGLYSKNGLHAISFGIIWKYLTPYCTCLEPLKKWQYILGAAMPTLILGFLPAFIAIGIHSPLIFWLSFTMIFSGGGDFFIILKILFYKSTGKTIVYYDHPFECGLVVFEKK